MLNDQNEFNNGSWFIIDSIIWAQNGWLALFLSRNDHYTIFDHFCFILGTNNNECQTQYYSSMFEVVNE